MYKAIFALYCYFEGRLPLMKIDMTTLCFIITKTCTFKFLATTTKETS